ncbi:lachesin-like [Pollicipes pollicipes]|uniref:lachesin-like n=1 Tax=Pollicipes pollicipes TaxID=41117 RepID=UPI0018858F77|nr:lachesin-like [Pollicipes pollicipes]
MRGSEAQTLAVGVVVVVVLGMTTSQADGSPAGGVHPQPSFSTPAATFQAKQGETIVLPCAINHKGPYIVVWKRERRVISAREAIVARDPRYSLQDGYNLRIDGVRPSDQSSYTCSLDTEPLTELTHRLEVLYRPVVSVQPAGGVLVVTRGEQAHFSCNASGNPPPKVAWRKQAGPLPSGETRHEGRVYTIGQVSRQMAGLYECVAENGLGVPGTATVSLQVQYPPEVEVEKSVVYSGEGFEAQLVCFVFADPPAEVGWAREGGSLDPSRHLSSERQLAGTRHVLTVRPVRPVDFGTYSCQAANALGSAGGRMVLTGTPERAHVTSSSMGTAPDSYQLAWEVHSYSPILEYRVAYRQSKFNVTAGQPAPAWRQVLVPPTGSEVVGGTVHRQAIPLTQLPPATLYDLHVEARNRHGWSAVSDMFHFSTLAKGEALESRRYSSGAWYQSLHPSITLIGLLVTLLISTYLSESTET